MNRLRHNIGKKRLQTQLLAGSIALAALLTGCASTHQARQQDQTNTAVNFITDQAIIEKAGWLNYLLTQAAFPDLEQQLAELEQQIATDADLPPEFLEVDKLALPNSIKHYSHPQVIKIAKNDHLLGYSELMDLFNQDHPYIDQWIYYFTTTKSGREQYQRFLDRLSNYQLQIESWLEETGMPKELIWLAFIESGMNPMAHSHAAAVGLWQFIPSTGKLYGLKYDFWLDERRDPHESTFAATKFLSELFKRFESWEFAFSAYNAGPGKVSRVINSSQFDNYWEMIVHENLLPRETKNYVPKLVAAYRIGQNPEQYGFIRQPNKEPEILVKIDIPSRISLTTIASELNIAKQTLENNNKHLRRGLTSPYQKTTHVYIPNNVVDQTKTWLAKGNIKQDHWGEVHIVEAGDTLWRLAQLYQTTIQELVTLNQLRSRSIYPKQRLVVPTRGGTKQAKSYTGNKTRSFASGSITVRRGDTLIAIAKRANISVDRLKQLNNLQSSSIYAGQKLIVQAQTQKTAKTQTRLSTSANLKLVDYTVQSGDSLWALSRQYGISVADLQRLNGNKTKIKAGDTLRIPKI